jgi:hypothetical protein
MNALRAADGRPLTATDQPAPCDHEPTAAPAGSPHPTREPLINLMISWSTLHQELRRHCGTASDVTDPFTFTDFCSRTTDGAPLDPADIVRAALLGHIRIIITDPAGRIERVGRRQRLFRGLTRDAVLLHHHQCIWPGCTIPASRCQADHLHPHREGGPTSISNGGPLCGFHNRFKAAFGYRIERTPGGHWRILRPDGTSITPTRRSPTPIRYGIEVDAAGTHPPRPGPSGWELAA